MVLTLKIKQSLNFMGVGTILALNVFQKQPLINLEV